MSDSEVITNSAARHNLLGSQPLKVMFNPAQFHEIVSGRRPGAAASAARSVFRLAEVPYSLAVRWRNRRFDRDAGAVEQVGVPVVSVGNLTLGGTGKTPLVKWLAHWFGNRGVRVAIVSRGYGAATGKKNDEALELAQALPNVPHVQNPDRVAGARTAIEAFGGELILLDDGFQHRRLARDLDIVLLDATEPFGFGHVFPRGKLREPIDGLKRAGVVCLSRSDLIDVADRNLIRRRVAQIAPDAAWCEAVHASHGLLNSSGETQTLETLAGRRVAAFCGIGNPAAFRLALEQANCQIVSWREYPDHHLYGDADRDELSRAAAENNAEIAVCTHKDLVKLTEGKLGERPLWALTMEMRISIGEESLEAALAKVVPLNSQ
jgi:tetraacyldisaccharide 4'-kinase